VLTKLMNELIDVVQAGELNHGKTEQAMKLLEVLDRGLRAIMDSSNIEWPDFEKTVKELEELIS